MIMGHRVSGQGVSMAYRLGVDLGTTFTAAAVANGMPPTMVGLGNRALQIPSVVFLTPEADFVGGESAERRGLVRARSRGAGVQAAHRRLGPDPGRRIAVLTADPHREAAPARWQTTTDRMGSAPEQIVLTHPANWGPTSWSCWTRSPAWPTSVGRPLSRAGRGRRQYAAQNRSRSATRSPSTTSAAARSTLACCDGRHRGFELMGQPEGIEHLGGIDFDEALFQHALACSAII